MLRAVSTQLLPGPNAGFPARWEATQKVQIPTQHRETFHHSTLLGLSESNVPTEKSALCSISTVLMLWE